MDILREIYLTVCGSSQCVTQEVQQFDHKAQCLVKQELHEQIPTDGQWKTIDYFCKPKDSINA